MRHLVTGGSGFVGARLAQRLLNRGEKVRILDVRDDPDRPAGIEFLEGSITDPDLVAKAMEGVEIVHHHAALVAQSDARSGYHQVNVEGSRIVAEAAVRAGAKALVHVSSTSVFGRTPPGPITERTIPRPFEPYGRSKLAAEGIVESLCGAAGMRLTTIRPRVVLGPGRLGIFEVLFGWIAGNRPVFVSGDGTNRQQFVHVDDLLDFYLQALDSGEGGTFNVGAAEFGTLRDDLERLIAHAGSRSAIRCLPAMLTVGAAASMYRAGLSPIVPWQYRTYHRDCFFDVEPLTARGWRPTYSNARMLAESFDWYRSGTHRAGSRSPHRSPLKRGVLALLERLA